MLLEVASEAPVLTDFVQTQKGKSCLHWNLRDMDRHLVIADKPDSPCPFHPRAGSDTHLRWGQSEQPGPGEVQVADGSHGDRVVRVVILH